MSIESIEKVSSFGRTRADPLWVPRLLDCRTFSPGFVEAIKFMPKTALMVSSRTVCFLPNSKNFVMGPVRR
jgi:hypothetical protein